MLDSVILNPIGDTVIFVTCAEFILCQANFTQYNDDTRRWYFFHVSVNSLCYYLYHYTFQRIIYPLHDVGIRQECRKFKSIHKYAYAIQIRKAVSSKDEVHVNKQIDINQILRRIGCFIVSYLIYLKEVCKKRKLTDRW